MSRIFDLVDIDEVSIYAIVLSSGNLNNFLSRTWISALGTERNDYKMRRIISIILSLSFLLSFCPARVFSRGFSDVDETCFAYEEINYLSDKGIIRGMGDGTFSPESFVTRADFAVMADRAMELAGGESKEFSDVFASD